LGGKVSITLARDYPNLVSKHIVIDIGIKMSIPRHSAYLEAMLKVDCKNISSRKDIYEQLENCIPEMSVRGFLIKNCIQDDKGQWKWRLNLLAIHAQYSSLLEEVTLLRALAIETHFIRGLDSDYISNTDIPKLKERFTHVVFHDIPNAGHWPHIDRPKTLLEILAKIFHSNH
jgi:esterase